MQYRTPDDERVANLQSALARGEAGLRDVPGALLSVIDFHAWQRREVLARSGTIVTFRAFTDFVVRPEPDGLGTTLEALRTLCRNDPRALDAFDRLTQLEHGGDRTSVDFKSNIVTLAPRSELVPKGNTRQNAMRRLRTHAPDLHASVLAGDLSANAAMIEAGFRERGITVPADTTKAARRLARHFNLDELMIALDTERKRQRGEQP